MNLKTEPFEIIHNVLNPIVDLQLLAISHYFFIIYTVYTHVYIPIVSPLVANVHYIAIYQYYILLYHHIHIISQYAWGLY